MASLEIAAKLSRLKIEQWIAQSTGLSSAGIGVSPESPRLAIIAFLEEHGIPEKTASDILQRVDPASEDRDESVLIALMKEVGQDFRRACGLLNELADSN